MHHSPDTTPSPSKPDHFGTKIGASAMAVFALTTVGLAMRDYEEPNPFIAASHIPEHFYEKYIEYKHAKGYSVCPDPLDQSELDTSLKLIQDHMNRDRTPQNAAPKYANERFAEILPRTEREIEAATDILEATTALNNYTQDMFGFRVSTAVYTPDSTKTINVERYKEELIAFSRFTAFIPPKLVDETKINHVVFSDLVDHTDGEAAGTYSSHNPENPTVQINFNDIGRPYLFIHEVLGHGLDHKICNRYMYNDPAISSLNPEGFTYQETKEKQAEAYAKAPDTFNQQYGTRSITEDKATILEGLLLDSSKFVETDGKRTPMAMKGATMLKRLNDVLPGSAEYLLSVSPVFVAANKAADVRMQSAPVYQ